MKQTAKQQSKPSKKPALAKPKPKSKPALTKTDPEPEQKPAPAWVNDDGKPMSNAEIARAKQLAEKPNAPIVRMMKHEVKVGDSVAYFADVEDTWTVVEVRGPWLRAERTSKDGKQSQCFLTDTMVPLELARKLPRVRDDGSVVQASLRKPRQRRQRGSAPEHAEPKKSAVKPNAKPTLHVPGGTSDAPKPKLRRKRMPVEVGTASPKEKKAAAKYMEGMREEHGACESIRATVAEFPKFTKEEIVEVAKVVGINPNTAAIQYRNAKQG